MESVMKPSTEMSPVPPVPRELSGKWIAWDSRHDRIIASGDALEEVLAAAERAGETDSVLEKLPRLDVHFVGAACKREPDRLNCRRHSARAGDPAQKVAHPFAE